MDNLKNGLTVMKQGLQHIDENQYAPASKCYSLAMSYLSRALISKQTSDSDSLKQKVNHQIEFCLKSLDALDIIYKKEHNNEHDEKESSLNGDDDGDGDYEILNRMKSTVSCKQSNLKFGDVCGLDKEKKLLAAAVILPVKFADSFEKRKAKYRAFLLYGV